MPATTSYASFILKIPGLDFQRQQQIRCWVRCSFEALPSIFNVVPAERPFYFSQPLCVQSPNCRPTSVCWTWMSTVPSSWSRCVRWGSRRAPVVLHLNTELTVELLQQESPESELWSHRSRDNDVLENQKSDCCSLTSVGFSEFRGHEWSQ